MTERWGRSFLRRHAALLVGLFVALACVALAPGAIDNIDTRICFRSAQSVLDRGTFALFEPTSVELEFLWTGLGTDGEVYSKFGTGETVTLLPFVLLGRALSAIVRIERGLMEEFLASLSSAVFTGIAAAYLFRVARDHLTLSPRASLIGVIGWVFGTFQLSHSGSSYLETPLALCVVLGVWFGLEARRSGRPGHAALAGFFAAWMVAVKAAMVICLPFVLLPLLSRNPRRLIRRGVQAGVPGAVVALWLMLLNHLRYGNPFSTGYVSFSSLFETPLLKGLGGYLLDPDIALFLFAPALLLALFGIRGAWTRSPVFVSAAVGVFVSGTVLHALHTGYHGGTCYGPRYLISAIALLVAPGLAIVFDRLRGMRRAAAVAFVVACVLLQLPSALVSPLEYHTIRGAVRQRGGALDDVHPRFTTDWRLFATKLGPVTDTYDLAELIDDPERVPDDRRYSVPRLDRGPAIWWVSAYSQGRRAALPVGCLLVAACIGLGAASMLATRAPPDQSNA